MNNKKRLFISTYYMEIGGVERSLIGLLNSIDYDLYEVDLFLHRHTGAFMKLIPSKVNLLPEDKKYATYARPVKTIIKEGHFLMGLARAYASYKTKAYNQKNDITENASGLTNSLKSTAPFLPSLKKYGTYDLAISFLMPHNIVLDKVSAYKKIAWIHTDYNTIYLNKKIELPIWSGYDYIAAVSESVKESFLKVLPSLSDKVSVIENILSSKTIRQQAEEFNVDSEMSKKNDEIVFCSVGRISHAKNFDQAVFMCQYLVEMGYNIKWYIIGGDGGTTEIKSNIKKTGMENHFFLLGSKTNPYPYIKACDFYIQPSRYEGKAVTVREAQILEKPVVITNFSTAKSQLNNGIDGIIVPMENEGAAKGISNFMEDKVLQEKIIQNLSNSDFGNESEVDKIYNLLNT